MRHLSIEFTQVIEEGTRKVVAHHSEFVYNRLDKICSRRT